MTRSDPIVIRLALEADCDPRSVLAVLEGRATRPRVRARIEKAAKKLKMKLQRTTSRVEPLSDEMLDLIFEARRERQASRG